MDVPVVGLGCPVRGGVEDQVVGDVAQHGAQPAESDLERPSDGEQVGGRTVVEVGSVGAGDDEHLIGGAAPERADHQDLLVGVDDPVADVLLGVDGGAQEAPTGEPGEAGLLLHQLAGDEGHPEQLTVGMLDRGAGFPAGVDDGLAVAQSGNLGVLPDPVADGPHHRAGLVVGQHGPRVLMVGGEDEYLVDSAGGGLGEHRSPIGDHERGVTFERRVLVRDDPDDARSRRVRWSPVWEWSPPRCRGRTGRVGRCRPGWMPSAAGMPGDGGHGRC